MTEVVIFFDVELPFWLGLKDGQYEIMVDRQIWPINLFNDKWKVSVGNEIDHDEPHTFLVNNTEEAKKIQDVIKGKPYYHKEKLNTMINTSFVWIIDGDVSNEKAKEIVRENFNWCKKTLLDRINRFIEIYRTSGVEDRIPYPLCYFDLCRNWWYSIFVKGQFVEGSKIGLDLFTNNAQYPIMLNESVQNQIAELLKSGYFPQPAYLLFENAVGSHIRGRYKTAVIEGITAFEIYLIDFLFTQYNEKKYNQELLDYLIKHCNNFNFMLLDGMRMALGKSFDQIDNKLWKEWCKMINPLRNDVIHRAKEVTENESETVIRVLDGMVNSLNSYREKYKEKT